MDEENGEASESLVKSAKDPMLFTYANTKIDCQEKIRIDCVVCNVHNIEHHELTSNTFNVQCLPFVVKIKREKKGISRRHAKPEELNISVHVSKEIGRFSSAFSVNFSAVKSSCQEIAFEVVHESTLNHVRNTISHAVEWEQAANSMLLRFRIHICAELPKGGFNWPSRAAIGFSGLRNEGATCYINSMLQSLFATNEFRRIVYGIPVEPDDANESLAFWLKYIFYLMDFGGLDEIRTNKMIQCFDWCEMSESTQQDIQEFLRRLLDNLYQTVEGTELHKRLEYLFVGNLEIVTKCETVDIVTVKNEDFWDLQLPLDSTQFNDIYGAFVQYLQPFNITGFDYGGGKDNAIRELKFTRMPPVLHISLNRFKFNVKTSSVLKNNDQFIFYPKLDLSQLCPDAVYTLHSVLVHSGRTTSGHYVAYVSPKADGEWFLFNDEIVTRCSLKEAVNLNYGNGSSNTSAYMLVYIKDSCAQEILRELSVDDVVSKELIDVKIAEERKRLQFKAQSIEVIVFTPEKLQMTSTLKRGGKLMDMQSSITFWIAKNSKVEDIRDSLAALFSLNRMQDISMWIVSTENGLVRYCDTQNILNGELKKLAKNKRVHLFIELSSMDNHGVTFDRSRHALIFIKEYDYSSNCLRYFGHHYFDLNQTAQNLRAYIHQLIKYDGNEDEIALIEESCVEEQYSFQLLVATKKIARFVRECQGTFSAVVAFELLGQRRKPKYLSAFIGTKSPLKVCQTKSSSPAMAIETDPKIVDGIIITIKHETNVGKELFSREFDVQDQIIKIVSLICELNDVAIDSIELYDSENNVISHTYFELPIQQAIKMRTGGMVTRSRMKNGLIFSYKVNNEEQHPMEYQSLAPPDEIQMDTSNIDEELDYEYYDAEADIFHEEQEDKSARHSMESTPVPMVTSADDWKSEKSLYLSFVDEMNNNTPMELNYTGVENVATAIQQITEVMELRNSNVHFYGSDGKELNEDLLNTSISEFIKINSATIKYEVVDRNSIKMQTVEFGIEKNVHCFAISDSTTVQDICQLDQSSSKSAKRVLRIKNGIICGIVPSETKVSSLLDDGFQYRLDVYSSGLLMKNEETFFVCVRFVGNSPQLLKHIPLLVEVTPSTTLRGLALRTLDTTRHHNKYMGQLHQFNYKVNDEFILVKNPKERDLSILIKPNDPTNIPLISIDMCRERVKQNNNRDLCTFFERY